MKNGQVYRPIYQIAKEIKDDWKNIFFRAKPYLDAMFALTSIDDNYGMDSVQSIINYFLGNARAWRGETARRIKAELKEMVK